jgi:hypothetical protein
VLILAMLALGFTLAVVAVMLGASEQMFGAN